MVRKSVVEDEYRHILRNLRRSATDAKEFIRLRKQVASLRPLRKQLDFLQRLQKEHANRRKHLLAEWESIQSDRFGWLQCVVALVSDQLDDRVRVKVTTASGDREPLREPLRDQIGGRLSEAIDQLMQAPDLSGAEIVQCCRSGATKVRQAYSIPAT